MKLTTLLKASLCIIFCAASLSSFAQTSRPFKGAWYSPEMYININFHEKNIPDINTMDEDPCPGLITTTPEYGDFTYSITSVKINGNKAVAEVDGLENKVTVTFTYMPNGNLSFSSSNFTYLPKEGEIKKFPSSLNLLKASPFIGTWTLKNKDAGKLTINLYNKCLSGMNAEGMDQRCYGTIFLMSGQRVDNCLITDCKVSNNQATIDYIGGRDGNTYRCTLVYNPANKQISIKGAKLIKHGEDQMEECYVSDGLIFYRQ